MFSLFFMTPPLDLFHQAGLINEDISKFYLFKALRVDTVNGQPN